MFENFDFNRLNDDFFKESDVREEIIMPLLNTLGISGSNIIREMPLKSNTTRQGSKDVAISIYPDYVLKHNTKIICVLDAKNPDESVTDDKHIGQIFSYASHQEIQTPICILCNGREMAVFKIPKRKPILIFNTQEIDVYLDELRNIIFNGNDNNQVVNHQYHDKKIKDYLNLEIPDVIRNPKKQSAKRHFGVHGYFTKQSWDVVQRHISNFTSAGDVVLDPFGGSGVTFTEAVIKNRVGIHVDLNPLSVFWVNSLFTNVTEIELTNAITSILNKFEKQRPKTKKDIEHIIKTLPIPKNIEIKAKGSDVKHLYELFTKKQIAELALLKSIIKKQNKNIRESLMLAFSSTVTQNNLTYHTSGTNEGQLYAGNCAAFQYYRYRIAKEPTIVDIAHSFKNKSLGVVKAKREIQSYLKNNIADNNKILKGDATNLKEIDNETIDYIYTDPPYGNKIPYLDLSAMWNAWLDFDVTDDDYQKEAIEGGSLQKTADEYKDLIKESIREMFRVLKWDRWMTFVFQHQDPKYWYLIVETAQEIGFEYGGCKRYANGQTSFKKRKNPFTVLSGQLIIYFKKCKNPETLLKSELGGNVTGVIMNHIEALIAKEHGATLEEIYDQLIVYSLDLGFLDILSKEHSDLTPLIREHFDFDNETNKYQIKKNTKFKSHISLEVRILYFLKSYLQRKNRENIYPTFDDIILDIMPMLKNGVTPEEQNIRDILERIAYRKGYGWCLNSKQNTLF